MRKRIFRVLFAACCVSAIHCGGGDDAESPSDGGIDAGMDGGKGRSGLEGGTSDGTVGDAGRKRDGSDREGAAPDGASFDGAANDATSSPNDGALPDGSGSAAPDASNDASLEPDVDAGDSVLRHHKNFNRDGVYVEPALTKGAVTGTAGSGDGGSADGGSPGLHQDPHFSASLPDPNDHVYAQPLFVDGLGGQDMVIVATEANNVYALNATTGAQLWVQNVGVPVPLANLPCGNIDPYGVTGTPVIDFPSRTLFFDAVVLPSGADAGDAGALPKHEIFALSIDTGAVKAGWPVDVSAVAKSGATGFNSPFQGQRGALAVLGDTLYVPYGGLFGDCQPNPEVPYPDPDVTPYHGWLVGVSISDPAVVHAWATPACAGGAWSPGGVSSDGTSLYLTTGNTQPACTAKGTVWGGGDAVLRFAPGGALAAPADDFAPANWPSLDNGDTDLGTAPVVFDLPNSTPGHLAIAFGKDGFAYLLDRTHLGGVGSALGANPDAAPGFVSPYATLKAADDEIITAPAVYTTATATYATFYGNGAFCQGTGGGTLATLTITPGTPPTLAGAWCGTGGDGSPMVTTSDGQSDAIVWQMGSEADFHLHAFDGDTGAPLAFPGGKVTIPNARRFNAPIAAKGRIFVAADGAVVAFTP